MKIKKEGINLVGKRIWKFVSDIWVLLIWLILESMITTRFSNRYYRYYSVKVKTTWFLVSSCQKSIATIKSFLLGNLSICEFR